MKTIANILLCALGSVHLFLFAGYSKSFDIRPAKNIQEDMAKHAVSQVVLSYEGKPVCVVSANRHPDLVPSFWTVANLSADNHPTSPLLPECDKEDIHRIYLMAQNSVLTVAQMLDIQTAALPAIPVVAYYTVTCVGGMLAGTGVRLLREDEKVLGFLSAWAGGMGTGYGLHYLSSGLSSFGKGIGVAGICGTATMIYQYFKGKGVGVITHEVTE